MAVSPPGTALRCGGEELAIAAHLAEEILDNITSKRNERERVPYKVTVWVDNNKDMHKKAAQRLTM